MIQVLDRRQTPSARRLESSPSRPATLLPDREDSTWPAQPAKKAFYLCLDCFQIGQSTLLSVAGNFRIFFDPFNGVGHQLFPFVLELFQAVKPEAMNIAQMLVGDNQAPGS